MGDFKLDYEEKEQILMVLQPLSFLNFSLHPTEIFRLLICLKLPKCMIDRKLIRRAGTWPLFGNLVSVLCEEMKDSGSV